MSQDSCEELWDKHFAHIEELNNKLKDYIIKAQGHGGGIGNEKWAGWTSSRIKIKDTGDIFYMLIRDDVEITDEIIANEIINMKANGMWY